MKQQKIAIILNNTGHKFQMLFLIWLMGSFGVTELEYRSSFKLILYLNLFFCLCLLGTLVVYFILSHLSVKKNIFKQLSLFGLYILSITIVGFGFVSFLQNQITFRFGGRIINAVNQYYQETGDYPSSIDQLKPNFLSNIPSAWIGLSFPRFQYIYTNNLYNDRTTISVYTTSDERSELYYDFRNKKYWDSVDYH